LGSDERPVDDYHLALLGSVRSTLLLRLHGDSFILLLLSHGCDIRISPLALLVYHFNRFLPEQRR
jgi:hypothetical protein